MGLDPGMTDVQVVSELLKPYDVAIAPTAAPASDSPALPADGGTAPSAS